MNYLPAEFSAVLMDIRHLSCTPEKGLPHWSLKPYG